MKKLLVVSVLLLWPLRPAQAENVYWNIGDVVHFQLPDSGKDVLPVVGYDVRFKQGIAGIGSSFVDIYKQISVDLGGVGVVKAQNNAQPYVAVSADLKKWIPPLASLSALELHVATRYNTDVGGSAVTDHLGAIFAAAYKF